MPKSQISIRRNRKKMNIAFILDEKYVMPAAVAITSIVHNKNKSTSYSFYIIAENISKDSFELFKKFETDDVKVNLIDVSNNVKYKNLEKKDFPVSTAALFKFDLPNLLPDDVEKVLYLDGDIIVQSDLTELYNTDISDVYAGVVKDYRGLTLKGDFNERLNINHTAYFNSGVLLLNLNLLRKDNIPEKLLEYRRSGINYYMDQDAFNVVFAEKVRYLTFYFNFQLSCWRFAKTEELSAYYNLVTHNDKYEYIKQSVILHYTADKPWKYYDYHCSDIWLYYYLISPFKNEFLERGTLGDRLEVRNCPEKYLQTRLSVGSDFNFLENKPDITVVIPVFNAEKFVNKALDSLRKQSLVNFEVICVNDGSTDNSIDILNDYAKLDSRIRVVDFKINRGAGIARNTAMKKAGGGYIVFLDADDELTQDALEKFYLKGLCTDADCVVSKTFNGKRVLSSSLKREYLPDTDWFSPLEISKYLFNFTHGGPSGKCVKRDFVINNEIFYPSLARSEDIFFVSKVLVLANRISTIDKALYKVNLEANPNSLEHTKVQTPLIFWEAVELVEKFLKEQNCYELYQQSFINSNIVRCAYNIKCLKNSENSNEIKVKKFFVDSGIDRAIIDKLKLSEYCDEYFFVPEYKELKTFLLKSFDEFIHDKLCEKDKEIADKRIVIEKLRNEIFSDTVNKKLKVELLARNKDLIKMKDELVKQNSDLIRLQNELANRNSDLSRLKNELANRNSDLSRLKNELANRNRYLAAIKNSISFRVGRTVTYIPRKIRDGIRCVKPIRK